MNRIWRQTGCPDCRQVPQPDANDILRCACKAKTWKRDKSVGGTEDERAVLASHGFSEEKDIRGNVYYVGPLRHIVELFTDGTWNSDKAVDGSTLDAYLKQFPKNDASL